MLVTGKKDESVKQPCKLQAEVCACLAARLFRAGVLGGEGALLMVLRPWPSAPAPSPRCQPRERR